MIERTTVRLPEELLNRIRRKAAAEGRTLTSLIEDGLRRLLAESAKPARSKPKLARVSTAAGGPKPGFEDITLSKIADLDNLDYAERMKHFK